MNALVLFVVFCFLFCLVLLAFPNAIVVVLVFFFFLLFTLFVRIHTLFGGAMWLFFPISFPIGVLVLGWSQVLLRSKLVVFLFPRVIT